MGDQKEIVVNYIKEMFIAKRSIDEDKIYKILNNVIVIYSIVFLFSVLIGNLWGFVRRSNKKIDDIFRFFTGRDRYRTVSLRFFTEYYGTTIAVTCSDGKKYIGVLFGAPDDSEDAIIINKPFVIENSKMVRISATAILIFMDKIIRIEVIKPSVRRELWNKKE
jgi:hypothetical protein